MSEEMLFGVYLIIGCSIGVWLADDKITKSFGVLAIIVLSITILLGNPVG